MKGESSKVLVVPAFEKGSRSDGVEFSQEDQKVLREFFDLLNQIDEREKIC